MASPTWRRWAWAGDVDVEAGLAFGGLAGGVDSGGDVEGFAGVA